MKLAVTQSQTAGVTVFFDSADMMGRAIIVDRTMRATDWANSKRSTLALAMAALLGGCGLRNGNEPSTQKAANPTRPSILLVTLDTTRADAIGAATPAFNALAKQGLHFSRAYSAVPETLPAHASMMTGLYPGGHGVHENARSLAPTHPLLAERLRSTGYETAAFVSSFVLARRFGLGRGFEVYDDIEAPERGSKETTDRAIEHLQKKSTRPRLVWVHYFDAHAPYVPDEPYRTQYLKTPYLGEVAAVDAQLARLVEAFERSAPGPVVVMVLGDHGEGLGDHGELQHGHLLYESTMRVPMVIAGAGVPASIRNEPVSTRRVFDTIMGLAGLEASASLLKAPAGDVVLGEAMKPFLEYGWQPQVMAVEGSQKTIFAGRNEVYDVVADPGEVTDLSGTVTPSRAIRTALQDYPIPSIGEAQAPASLSDEDRRKLASLGYVSAGSAPVIRKDAPRPADMTGLFDTIERASGLFVRAEYRAVIPLLERILAKDPQNLDATLRLATAFSSLGQEQRALSFFERAKTIAPQSTDVKLYLALHLERGAKWQEAAPMLEKLVVAMPDRLPALDALARIREREGRASDGLALLRRIHALRAPTATELIRLGRAAMDLGETKRAIEAFEGARRIQGTAFTHDLELGVLYLADRRYDEARQALDRVPARHPEYPMVLFKRAQVSVLLREPDQAARIELARRRADASTRELIARERLFRGAAPGRE
jgi:choline-sulfatase